MEEQAPPIPSNEQEPEPFIGPLEKASVPTIDGGYHDLSQMTLRELTELTDEPWFVAGVERTVRKARAVPLGNLIQMQRD